MAASTPTWGPLSDTQRLILLATYAGPRPAYGILRDVARLGASKPRCTLAPFYRALRRLTADGMVEVVSDAKVVHSQRRRLLCALTEIAARG